MKYPVLILHRNSPMLTGKAVDSAVHQSVPTDIIVIDNSERNEVSMLESERRKVQVWPQNPRVGVSRGWNIGLKAIFSDKECNHALVLNNDAIIPRWFYEQLLSYSVPFITGIAVDDMRQTVNQHFSDVLTPNPDFSAFLISRYAWQQIGPFNEDMVLYASDCDYHVRGFRKNIAMMKADVPYYHERSSTMKNAREGDQEIIRIQADHDRQVFRNLYGCIPGEPEYAELFNRNKVTLQQVLYEIMADPNFSDGTRSRAKGILGEL